MSDHVVWFWIYPLYTTPKELPTTSEAPPNPPTIFYDAKTFIPYNTPFDPPFLNGTQINNISIINLSPRTTCFDFNSLSNCHAFVLKHPNLRKLQIIKNLMVLCFCIFGVFSPVHILSSLRILGNAQFGLPKLSKNDSQTCTNQYQIFKKLLSRCA